MTKLHNYADLIWSRLRIIKLKLEGFDIYDVEVDDIQHKVDRDDIAEIRDPKSVRGVVGGDWDLVKKDFNESIVMESFRQHFVEGQPWEVTPYYEFKSMEDRSYFEKYDELYADIKENGYNRNRPIAVFIGRSGEYILNHGYHRLAIMKIIEEDIIPVRVKARHREWVDGVNSDNSVDITHPDIQYCKTTGLETA